MWTWHRMVIRGFLLLSACSSLADGLCTSKGAQSRLISRRLSFTPMKSKQALADWLIAPIRSGESDAGAASQSTALSSEDVVAFPGGGLFFWWQLGWIRAAPVDFAADNVRLSGASAGSLAAVCARCGVDTEEALAVALELCERDKIFEEPLGLAGKWGPIVREWLNMLLPSDAHLRCKGRVFVLVTALGSGMTPSSSPLSSFGSSSSEGQGTSFAVWPPLRRVRVTDFVDRKDLLDALLASVHIPFFMDGRAWATFRGLPCVDGSFLERPNEIAASMSVSLSGLPQSSPQSSKLPRKTAAGQSDVPGSGSMESQPATVAVDEAHPISASDLESTSLKDVQLELLLPTVIADHKVDDGLADRQFLRLKPGPELVRALIDRGAAYAQEHFRAGP